MERTQTIANRGDTTGETRSPLGWVRRYPLGWLSSLAAVGVILIAITVLLGWFLQIPLLLSVLPGLPPMVPQTAIGLILAGASLLLLQPNGSAGRQYAGQAAALLCLLLGLGGAVGYLQLPPATELAQLTLPLSAQEPPGLSQSLSSALAFSMAGLSLFLLGFNRAQLIYTRQWLAILTLAMAIVVLFGYLYGIIVSYRYTEVIGMALPASIAFIILANGILLARPNEGVMRLITSDSAGGVLLRRLLPAIILAHMAIGWLTLTGQNAGIIPEEFGFAINEVLSMLLITVIVSHIAVSLNREEKLRRAAEEGTKQHQADLAHLVRLNTMGEMVANIAHELKQPLTAISLYAANSQTMLSSPEPQTEQLHKMLDEIQAQAMRAAEIIRRTREFARKQKPDTSSIQLNGLIAEVRDFLAVQASDHDVSLLLELDPELPPAEADAVQLKQVLLNIVHNAIECLQGYEGLLRQVTVRSHLTEAGEIEVNVTDTGPGMDAETLGRVFESFFTTKGDAGMGMGLSISRSIIEAHGGQLWARSVPGRGATFSFTLPTTA